MALPKQITHTAGILIAAVLLMVFLWLSPTKQDDEVVPRTNPRDMYYYQITELLPEGFLVLDKVTDKQQINHPRFVSMTQKEVSALEDFFVGRFIQSEKAIVKAGTLELPLSLFHPACFSSSNQNSDIVQKQCPIVLKP